MMVEFKKENKILIFLYFDI